MNLIGVATHRRQRRLIPVFLDHVKKFGPAGDYQLVIASDGPYDGPRPVGAKILALPSRRGVAANKNQLFRVFWEEKKFDHLFLFEDDCYPIFEHWDEWWLSHHEEGVEALLFLPHGMYGPQAWQRGRLVGYERDGGLFLSLTRRAIERVGGFHRAFAKARYGGEHSEFMRRLKRNGLIPYTYLTARGCEKWLDGWDVANWRGAVAMAPGYKEWTTDVEKLPMTSLRREAEKGLAIFERVKDDASVFHDPRW